MSDREREAPRPDRPNRAQDKQSRPTASVIEGIGCEPSEACLDGEAPLSREPSE